MADEEYREDQEEYEEEEGGFKTWLQDNIRIILAVLIVVAIAVGLYSYSQRVPEPGEEGQETAQQEEGQEGEEEVSVTEETDGQEDEVVTENGDVAISGDDQESGDQVEVGNGVATEGQQQAQGKGKGQTTGKGGWTVEEEQEAMESMEEQTTSQSTHNSGEAITVTAQQGDSITTMARRALAEYLNQTGETGLNAQHKVFVEDYLRKRASQQRVSVGEEISFSKSMIQQGIQEAKNLNQSQLSYLERFSSRVPNL
jgi:hypothetical protein